MDYTTGLSKYFKERFTELGGKIALEDSYMTTDTDFSAQVSRLKSAGDVDAVFASSGPDTAGPIVKQIREAGIDLPDPGRRRVRHRPRDERAGPELANNVWFTTHAYAGVESGPAQEFRKAYEAEYGVPPENAFAALGYDAMGLVADAISRAGSAEPAAIQQALAATKGYEGVTGTIAYLGDSHVPSKPVAIMHVEDGKMGFETTVTPKA